MSGEGLPSGTPMQVEVFDAIARGEVHGHPGFRRPKSFWKPNELTEIEVTGRVTRLLGAKLLAWEPAWRPGADRQAKYLLDPTDAGLAWRERCAERERRAAARRAAS